MLLAPLRLSASEALRALSRHRFRSALTALGITIGTAAVVCVVAITQSGSDYAEAQLRNLGDNLVWIEAGARNVNGVRTGTHGTTSLTLDDATAIAAEVPLVRSVSPQVDGSVQVVFEDHNWATRYRGVAPSYLGIKRWEIAEGTMFSDEQTREVSSVCVIGRTVREQLFGSDDPLGQLIRVQAQLFTVVGVLAPKGQSTTGQDQDDTIFLPYTTAISKVRGKSSAWLDDIVCSAATAQLVNPAIDDVVALLRQRHHVRGEEDDFNIRRPDDVIKAQLATSRTLSLQLICVALVSLIIGGIGIMNVMLASVAQRTQEIGLRLAIGASEGAVQLQFLGEAVMLSLFGGIAGVLLGVAGSFLIGHVMEWPTAIPWVAIVAAPFFSAVVGIFFGYSPARRAARLDPIAALRME